LAPSEIPPPRGETARLTAAQRRWKLRALIKQEEDGMYQSRHKDKDKDWEHFLEDVDTDADLRQKVNVYKDPSKFRLEEDGRIISGPAPTIPEDDGECEAKDGEYIDDLGDMLDDLVLGEDEEEAVGQELGYESGDSDGPADGAPGPSRKGKGKSRASPY
jgi:hypothetical protein